ncbi:hypothetical protein [Hyphomicrobium sp. DY-1]|uniref:hypothetical protein n=1 Tax=Hyphomicrobium sp. DY-1 TaxID=3075650 RepID=UPI0039C4D45B
MRILPFTRAHLENFEPLIPGLFDVPEYHILSLENAYSFSLFHDDGRIIAIGGLADNWPGRRTAWFAMSKHSGRHMTAITRATRNVLARVPSGERVEATTCKGFAAGYRWLEMLGFEKEAECMKAYTPGQDHALFAMVAP